MAILPRWDLSPIYPAADSSEFTTDLKKVVSLSKTLEERLAFPSVDILEAVKLYELILDYYENLNAYSSCCLSTDTSNPIFLKAVNQVAEMSLSVQHLDVVMLNFLSREKTKVFALAQEGKPLASYRYVLGELLERQEHLLSPQMEDLAADLNRSGTEAFSRLQEALSSSVSIEWEGKTSKTVIELRNEAFNADRAIREKAFNKELSVWKTYEMAFAASINGVKGATLSLDKARQYESPLDRSLSQSRIDKKTLDALISTLEKNLSMFRSYLAAKAKALNLEKCAFYDLFAPVGKGGKQYSYEEARSFIIEQFNAFSPGMGTFAQHAFDNGWIDPEARKGKVGGAYDTSFPLAQTSRILSNFDFSFNGVSTLAHELGHAYHDSVVLPKSNLMRTYPMTLAETASIFSEYLVFQGAIANCSSEERFTLVEHFLQDACQVCVDILCRFYFEQELFIQREDHELTPDQLSQLMVECQKKTYGEALGIYHPYMWAVKGHYYSSDFSFYNYPYAFGQLFALGLYAQRAKDPEKFPGLYVALLEKTGSDSAFNVASTMGCDITSEQFWQQGMDLIATYVKEFSDACQN
ncbi:M3 family oligoendopeptidase [uncultured Sphaerochaeta sp.]|uniref:M3 family oligoendopeptidase n=1 Tax=uncultured Sphaerochaeta sp. TaxID=886478 RepID=UPI002A0A16E9|nr:M3 family oligoendopeptidase [uncultured Sphaerochaeta sp.]